MFTQAWWSVICHPKMPSIAYVKEETSIVQPQGPSGSLPVDHVSPIKRVGVRPARSINPY